MKRGRKKIEIDWKEFEKLCVMQCTLIEIANWFKCSEDTIERRCKEEQKLNFAEYFKKKSAAGKISLRRSQFKAATDGNVTMLIWLGKQYLEQSDKQQHELSGVGGGPIETINANMDPKKAAQIYAQLIKGNK